MKQKLITMLAVLSLTAAQGETQKVAVPETDRARLAGLADIYLTPRGSDQAEGTRAKPLASLAAARDKARSLAGKEAVTIYVADGVYYLPETLVFTPADSGSAKWPVVYKAVNEGGAVLSGGSKLDL